MTVIKLPEKPKADPQIVAMLERLLDEAQNGRLAGIVAAYTRPGGGFGAASGGILRGASMAQAMTSLTGMFISHTWGGREEMTEEETADSVAELLRGVKDE